MSKNETYFRKYATHLGKFPTIILPIVGIGLYAYINTHNVVVPITVLILVCVTIGTSYVLGSIVKLLYYKPRPEPQHFANRFQKIDASSFPSIHTANSMIVAFRGILSAIQVSSQEIGTYLIIAFRFLFFMTISLSRVVLKKHFPIDIIAGVLFGTICIMLVAVNSDFILGIMDSIVQKMVLYIQ